MESLEYFLDAVGAMSHSECGEEIINERRRIMEILYAHAEAGWIKHEALTRLLNFICDPNRFENWKKSGGDRLG